MKSMNSFNSLWKLAASFVVLTSFADAGPFSIPETQLASVRPQFPTGGGPFVIPKTKDDYPPPPILSTPEVTYGWINKTRQVLAGYQKQCVNGVCSQFPVYRTETYPVWGPVASSQYVLPGEAQSTPNESINKALAILARKGMKAGDRLLDPGCGADARVLIAAVKKYGVIGIGIEIDHGRAESARRNVADAGLSGSISILEGDSTTMNVPADWAFAYIGPETLEKLKPQLKRLKGFVTYHHAAKIPGAWTWDHGGGLYSWPGHKKAASQVPQATLTQQPLTPRRYAVWNGQIHTRDYNPACGCPMCVGIRRQLGL